MGHDPDTNTSGNGEINENHHLSSRPESNVKLALNRDTATVKCECGWTLYIGQGSIPPDSQDAAYRMHDLTCPGNPKGHK